MSDAAAFFASKKKKKKAFKFNANLVDASTVTPTVHVDAPALSTAQEGGDAAPVADSTTAEGTANGGAESSTAAAAPTAEGWDDEAASSTFAGSSSATGASAASNVLDMKSLAQSKGKDNIAQKLRLEETKAQLAAAREGMEREAAKLKEEKERKEAEQAAKQQAQAQRFGAAASSMGGGGSGGRWLPPHLRGGSGGGTGPGLGASFGRARMGGGSAVDTASEELFPDLAAADKILEQKEKSQQPAFRAPKKTPVGGGATWASAKKAPAKPPMKKVEDAAVSPTAAGKPPQEAAKEEPATTTAAPAPATAAAVSPSPVKAMPKKTGTKKKKKDLSTFKPS